MSKKKLIIIILCVALASAALGIIVYAAVGYGTQEDPLITKSYLDEVLQPKLEADFKAEMDKALAEAETGDAADFTVITLTTGQTVVCEVGCEVMLRIGSATASGADFPVLVDTTSGESISNGSAMKANHLYMVTIKGNGFVAGSATTKLLIKGDYTIY